MSSGAASGWWAAESAGEAPSVTVFFFKGAPRAQSD